MIHKLRSENRERYLKNISFYHTLYCIACSSMQHSYIACCRHYEISFETICPSCYLMFMFSKLNFRTGYEGSAALKH